MLTCFEKQELEAFCKKFFKKLFIYNLFIAFLIVFSASILYMHTKNELKKEADIAQAELNKSNDLLARINADSYALSTIQDNALSKSLSASLNSNHNDVMADKGKQ